MIQAKQLFFLDHVLNLEGTFPRWCVHLLVIVLLAFMDSDFLDILVLVDTITVTDHAHEPDQFWIIRHLLACSVLHSKCHENTVSYVQHVISAQKRVT